MSSSVQPWYDFVLQQMVAESYIHHASEFGGALSIGDVLMFGSNNPAYQGGLLQSEPLLPGATRMTATQAEDFLTRYEIVSHLPNTASGFSGTLMREISTGAYTLSFRSTEFFPTEQGGDRARDFGTNFDIGQKGFAFGQIASMESYYEHLKLGQSYNFVSGEWESDPSLDDFRTRLGNGVGPTQQIDGKQLSS